jgi:DNA-binding transcriptional ArsR family regulator
MHVPDGDKPAALDQRLVRALDHPVRVKFLKLLAERESLSPEAALPLLESSEVALGNLTYHARVLDQIDLIEPTEEPTQHGGASFRATSKGELAIAVLGF